MVRMMAQDMEIAGLSPEIEISVTPIIGVEKGQNFGGHGGSAGPKRFVREDIDTLNKCGAIEIRLPDPPTHHTIC
jgi:hypothetical protein